MPQNTRDVKNQFDRVSRVRLIVPILVAVILVIIAVVSYVLVKRVGGETAGPTSSGGEITFWTTSISEETLAEIISDFEAANPGITVNYESKPKVRYQEVLKTRLQTSTNFPDVFEVESVDIPAVKNYLSKASSISGNQLDSNFFPGSRHVCEQSGLVRCVPLEFDGLVLAYNADRLAQAGIKSIPDNWSSFKQAANSLTVKTTSSDDKVTVIINGVAMGAGSGITRGSEIAWLLMLQNGVVLDQDLGWTKMSNEKGVAAAEVYASYYTDNIWARSGSDDLESFISGQTIMIFVTKDDLDYILSQNPGFVVKTTAPPQVSGQRNMGVFGAVAVANASSNQEAAWKFAEYLSSSEVQGKLETISSRRDLLHKTSSDTQLKGFTEIFLSSESVVFPDYSMAKSIMSTALDDIADGNSSENALKSAVSELR